MGKSPENSDERKKPRGLALLGPGIIAGASDDDPSGIATYSQVGAQFGYGMLWTMLFSFPLMEAVQEISARIGRVTGRGLAANMRLHQPRWVVLALCLLLFIANTVNIGTDIDAMGSAVALVIPGPAIVYALALGLLSLALEILLPYRQYVKWLRWLSFALLAYVAVAFTIHVDWGRALHNTLIPGIRFGPQFLTALLAVLGTTISPYVLFWQAGQEVEEEDLDPDEQPLHDAPQQAPHALRRIAGETFAGMFASNAVAWFIILAAAVTLFPQGIHRIDTATQAASALRPLAGGFAFTLFALGIVGTGLLAVPVLAGSAAYAVGEALNITVGLEHRPGQARGFYLILALATLLGMGLMFLHVNPMRALFWTAVINGVACGPLLAAMLLLAGSKKVMGEEFTLHPYLKTMGWLTCALMLASAAGMFLSLGK